MGGSRRIAAEDGAPVADTECDAAISACEKGMQWGKAFGLLQEMPTWALQSDVISCSAAMSACEKGMQWEAALGLLPEMPRRSLQPDLFSIDAAITGCEKGM